MQLYFRWTISMLNFAIMTNPHTWCNVFQFEHVYVVKYMYYSHICRKLKERRTKEQDDNIKRKEDNKLQHKKKCLDGMQKTEKESDPGFEEVGANKDTGRFEHWDVKHLVFVWDNLLNLFTECIY